MDDIPNWRVNSIYLVYHIMLIESGQFQSRIERESTASSSQLGNQIFIQLA